MFCIGLYIGPILLNYNLSLAQIEVMFAKNRHHFQRCRLRSLENLSSMKFCLKSDTFLPVLILKKSMAKLSKIWVPCFCHSSGCQNRTQNFHNSTPQGIKQKHLHKCHKCQHVYQSNKPHHSFTNTEACFCRKLLTEKPPKKNLFSALILQCLQVYWTWCPVHRIVVDSARFSGLFMGWGATLMGWTQWEFSCCTSSLRIDHHMASCTESQKKKETPPFCQCAQQATFSFTAPHSGVSTLSVFFCSLKKGASTGLQVVQQLEAKTGPKMKVNSFRICTGRTKSHEEELYRYLFTWNPRQNDAFLVEDLLIYFWG